MVRRCQQRSLIQICRSCPSIVPRSSPSGLKTARQLLVEAAGVVPVAAITYLARLISYPPAGGIAELARVKATACLQTPPAVGALYFVHRRIQRLKIIDHLQRQHLQAAFVLPA